MKRNTKSLADKLFPIQGDYEDLAIIDIPPEKRRLITETYDFSISTIYEYLKNDDIYIPSFQRKYVWNRAQASRLIESLIIQVPIPVIYLHQEKDEKLAVIDGNQRLKSIQLFLEDEFELAGLTAYPELTGNRYSELDPRFKRHILNRTLRCISILKETHPQIKIDVFERLNTGAVQLNPQEIRHGIYHGTLMSLIDELSTNKIWREISGLKKDDRMKGGELILRYFSLSSDLDRYKKPLKTFLDSYCEENAYIDDKTQLELKTDFLTTISNVNTVFGKKSYRLLDTEFKPLTRSLNAALYDAVMIGFKEENPSKKTLKKLNIKRFLKNYQRLLDNSKFRETIESGTSATSSVKRRIRMFKIFLKKNLI